MSFAELLVEPSPNYPARLFNIACSSWMIALKLGRLVHRSTNAARRSARMLLLMPGNRRRKSLKRGGPTVSSRRIGRTQRWPRISAARARGQNC